jgi:hypothetical protein
VLIRPLLKKSEKEEYKLLQIYRIVVKTIVLPSHKLNYFFRKINKVRFYIHVNRILGLTGRTQIETCSVLSGINMHVDGQTCSFYYAFILYTYSELPTKYWHIAYLRSVISMYISENQSAHPLL